MPIFLESCLISSMEKLSKTLYLFALLFLIFFPAGSFAVKVSGEKKKSHAINGFRAKKLFVFGDSYADTGNSRKTNASSWKQPYGTTFPGKPSGRFSDGRVLTDFLAKYLGVKSPIPYRWMDYGRHRLEDGMNFAYGGTGVFDTLVSQPNMTSQISFFQKLLDDSVYTKTDVESSLFLVTLAGNDYGAYLAKGGTTEGMPAFISSVVNQLAENLKRIHGLGATKVGVTSLEPLGCLPRATVTSSFRQCNATQNAAVTLHNELLKEAVERLNNHSTAATFVILDLYTSFTDIIDQKESGTMMFETPLKPCCLGTSDHHYCGSVDEKGVKMYTVCDDPNAAFFWDGVHPTQAGWRAVYASSLKPALQQMFL